MLAVLCIAEALELREGGVRHRGTCLAARSFHSRDTTAEIAAMPNRDSNDTRLITPLLLMGMIVVCGLLYFTSLGHACETKRGGRSRPARAVAVSSTAR
jgi:hypothetical protein